MKRFLIYLLIALMAVACGEETEVQTELELLKNYCTASSNADYYAALESTLPNDIFTNKKIVACGQSSHGSHENFEIQIELFKYLVARNGCRTFVIEGNYSSILVVNKYVNGATYSKQEVMRNLGFWTWDTEEVWEMIRWMREYNQKTTEENRIIFLGNDVQIVRECAKGVAAFFEDYDTLKGEVVLKLLQPLLNDSTNYYSNQDSKSLSIFSNSLEKIKELANEVQSAQKNPLDAKFVMAKYSINILQQSLIVSGMDFAGYVECRDSMMAENVKWITSAKLRNGLIYLWAHNGHIQKQESGSARMGYYLDEWYRNQYFAIGVDFAEGSFNACQPLHDTLSATPSRNDFSKPKPGTIDLDTTCLAFLVRHRGTGVTYFDVASSRTNDRFRKSKLFMDAKLHSVGAVFNPEAGINGHSRYLQEVNLERHFDGILFFEKSTPTKLLCTPKDVVHGN